MEYRRLGSTGLRISRLGLGCGCFGGIGSASPFYGKGESEPEAFALMDRAWEAGINFFDTADAYGGGRSETFIGHWLKDKGSHVRDQILLSSKVFNPIGEGPNDRGLSRRHILRQIDASLTRLGTDRLDMYLIHEPDPETPLEETLRALDDLVHMGKVLYIGASNIEAWRMARALWISDKNGLARFEWVQNSYSLLDRAPEAEVFPLCADQGLGFTAFGPLAGGWLTGRYRRNADYPAGSRMTQRPDGYRKYENTSVFDALEAFEARAAKYGVSIAGLAIAWLLEVPEVTAVVVGPTRAEQLEPVREALALDVSADDCAHLRGLFP